jgi:hypothetical protein
VVKRRRYRKIKNQGYLHRFSISRSRQAVDALGNHGKTRKQFESCPVAGNAKPTHVENARCVGFFDLFAAKGTAIARNLKFS